MQRSALAARTSHIAIPGPAPVARRLPFPIRARCCACMPATLSSAPGTAWLTPASGLVTKRRSLGQGRASGTLFCTLVWPARKPCGGTDDHVRVHEGACQARRFWLRRGDVSSVAGFATKCTTVSPLSLAAH